MDTSQSSNPRHVPAFLAERCRETVDMAKRYVEAGIVIVKTHAPIFSESGRVGCTCEAYKRGDKYRRWCEDNGKPFDPNYACPNPGKHPFGNWKNETVGVTLDKVVDTWGRFYQATDVDTGKRVQVVYNIGTLTGPSDLLTLDADTYKKHYQCDLADLIDLDDQETPQAITQSGGMHLLFARQGKPYTSANGELKAAGIDGVDIRGEGGFQVLAPSLGPSGNQYGWVEGYEPWTVAPRPIPAALDAILASAAVMRTKATAKVTFTTPTTERPDLGQWRVSKGVLDLIHNPLPRGQRSEADYSICLSLCYAGASDDDILAVFEHYPIGANGKFAEAGRAYLAHTIAKARAYAAVNPRANTDATIAHYRHLVEFGDWSQIVPLDRQSAAGYRTGDTDRKLFDNVLDIMQRAGKMSNVTISYRQLITAKNADGLPVAIASVQTAKNFLGRLNGVLLTYTNGEKGSVVSLISPVVVTLDTSNIHNYICNEVSKVTTTGVYTSHKADDAFAIGTARWAREVIVAEKAALMAGNPVYAEAAMAYRVALKSKPENVAEKRALMGSDLYDAYRELMAKATAGFLPGLGTFGLLVVADLLDNPFSAKKEIAERRGLKPSAVGTVLRKLEQWELVEVDQPFGGSKSYTLVGDIFGEIEERLPEAKTYRIGAQRLDRRLEKEQAWAARQAEQHRQAGDSELQRIAEQRVDRIAQRRFETAPIAHPEMDQEEVARFIYVPGHMPIPAKPDAPRSEAPGLVAYMRLYELAGRDLLTKAEFIEMVTLNDTVGGGLQFEENLMLADCYRQQAGIQALVDATAQMPYEDDDVDYLLTAAGL